MIRGDVELHLKNTLAVLVSHLPSDSRLLLLWSLVPLVHLGFMPLGVVVLFAQVALGSDLELPDRQNLPTLHAVAVGRGF